MVSDSYWTPGTESMTRKRHPPKIRVVMNWYEEFRDREQ